MNTRRVLKRRCVSAAATNTPTIVSITGRNSRGKRTNSATNRKRSYSPASITLPLSNNNQRKKQKVSHHWILFGKSEQKLVSIHVKLIFSFFKNIFYLKFKADKPPVFRECYSSIQHITEKDIIKSDDCIILRSETCTRTPYLAKVKWFWEEPTTGKENIFFSIFIRNFLFLKVKFKCHFFGIIILNIQNYLRILKKNFYQMNF